MDSDGSEMLCFCMEHDLRNIEVVDRYYLRAIREDGDLK